MFDYEVLKVIWWVLIGVLLIGFAIMDGMDFGALIMLKLVGKSDEERRVVLNAVAPHWDGNQVWFITAGGAIFAAWPIAYSLAFSGFYWAMLLVLFSLFLRPTGFDYRSKIDSPRWRNNWDWLLLVGGLVPTLVFGVAFGNLLQGVPFHYDDMMRNFYEGNLFGLLNPFAILCGVVSVAMIATHGSMWIQLRSTGEVSDRARKAVQIGSLVAIVAFALAGIWLSMGIDGYKLVASSLPHDAFSSPMHKEVVKSAGAWLTNYSEYPITIAAPVLGFAGFVLAFLLAGARKPGLGFVCTGLGIAGIILTAGVSMFPFIMPSSLDPNVSLTLWDAASSQFTLTVMTIAAIIFVPIILLYTTWCYYRMWTRYSVAFIKENDHGVY